MVVYCFVVLQLTLAERLLLLFFTYIHVLFSINVFKRKQIIIFLRVIQFKSSTINKQNIYLTY